MVSVAPLVILVLMKGLLRASAFESSELGVLREPVCIVGPSDTIRQATPCPPGIARVGISFVRLLPLWASSDTAPFLPFYADQTQAKRDWPELKRVIIHETSSKRGHRYMNNFVDSTTQELLFLVEEYGAES